MTHSAEPDDQQLHQPADTVRRSPWRWVSLALAVIAVAATGVAVWALTRSPSDTAPAPTAQQVQEAKARACEAYAKVRTAVALQTQAEVGTDPIATQALAANARLAMSVGSEHLVDNLSSATPPELAGLLRTLATDLQNLTINALAGTADDEAGQVARLRDLETNSTKIVDLCK
ncbi:hypothetical protein TUM20985_52680 [Mycobacterium antarcticum]|uniref:hypothetical protein n=1 Tax=unclassified Mycolicibacterium TaxID=2636767 RepID=UPI002399D1FC|nr:MULTISPECIES: hypothetical protein [unclassified Mycolicibacterium]BDX34721.1 hypothetical protein TUM20985_52680 [Mycolicibacterium sp. TUM20985]GLP77924.1 hypothetical protein TUM20983_50340 [Mycolicibacterium sp. TUM20983]GLP81671.1 hypothetical protein TUM20984_30910 [Mycolicibacterium sp. TUM20984]